MTAIDVGQGETEVDKIHHIDRDLIDLGLALPHIDRGHVPTLRTRAPPWASFSSMHSQPRSM